jgi:hypothetical protein
MKEIHLTQGKIAFVDDGDYEQLNKFKWHANKDRNTFYAARQLPLQTGGKQRQRTQRMHRIILNPSQGFEIDHLDGNGLNNQKSNLRIVTTRENCQNKHTQKTSRYPGVCRVKTGRKRWQAYIDINRKRRPLGYFKTEEAAHQAYISACNELVVRGRAS